MFGPFKEAQTIFYLLEIIFSALSLIIIIFRGRMVLPWGEWCEFVWVFCIIVPVVLWIVEAFKWQMLLAAFLSDWDDLTCGLTMLCAVMITSATIIFAARFVCFSCFIDIIVFIFSLVATVVFLIDAVKRKRKSPNGYLTSLRGILRTTEAFITCIILTAAADHYVTGEWAFKPFGTSLSIAVFVVCLLATVIIIIIHLLKMVQALLPIKLSKIEFVFNIAAVVLYLLVVILWIFFGYRHYQYNPYICRSCATADLNTVSVGSIVNLILYIVDLILSYKSL